MVGQNAAICVSAGIALSCLTPALRVSWSRSRLIDTTARLFRPGEATISAELAGIFDRLGTNAPS
jgi:hypothetical protein